MAKPTSRKGAQRNYMMTHTTGVSAQTPLGQLERVYYLQYLAGALPNPPASLKQLKFEWMRQWIKNNSGTAPSQNFESDLWKAMVSTLNIKPVTSTSTNIMNFWLNAT